MAFGRVKDFLAADFAERSVWVDETPPAVPPAELPEAADVIVIGSGYTGLSAGLHLARGGRSVTILEAEEPGHGCSTRNGGQVSSGMKLSLAGLTRRFGAERATTILGAGLEAHRFLRSFVASERLDCDYVVCGHFLGAHAPDRYEGLAAYATEQTALGNPAALVPRSEQYRYAGTDSFHGGVFLSDWSSIDPGRYHRELLRLALAAGVAVIPRARVEGVDDRGGHVEVSVRGRKITARDVVVATDGYTGKSTPWLHRRIIPISSFVMATEELDPARISRIYPQASMLYDTRKRVSYSRPLPDGRRILFGTRVPIDERDPMASIPAAVANMARAFPDLQGVKLSRAWYGMVGYTFDELPHIGSRGKIHYALGYCGTGIAMATLLGARLAGRLLGGKATTGLDAQKLRTIPLYNGRPWFLKPLLAYYKFKDERAH